MGGVDRVGFAAISSAGRENPAGWPDALDRPEGWPDTPATQDRLNIRAGALDMPAGALPDMRVELLDLRAAVQDIRAG